MDKSIDKRILQIIAGKNPETIGQLVELVRQEIDFSDKEILEHILILQTEGKISLKRTPVVKSSAYTILSKAYWYWATLIFTVVTLFLVLQIPENAYPVVYARYFFGSLFVLLMPGYALIKALYPAKRLDSIERIGLSIGMSIALVCLDAFLLNFSPWKITLLSLVLSLSAVITVFATIAVTREIISTVERNQ
jgi:uncharacterized membrane protein